ncbi:MAG: MG2 domain-containing protein, partial [Bacteroidota bacterium]|nr:MG2 domain-containing protein [Bacteroidota bacterium]
IPLNINSKGVYLVKVTAGNKVADCGFIISDLGIISKAGNSSMLAFVVERKSGNPVSNAELNFYLGAKKIGQGKTDKGMFYQSVTEEVKVSKDEDMTPMIIGKYNDDIVVSDSYLFFGYSGNKYYTYIYTEQPVYRTGSVVNFKGTIRKNISNKLEPLSNKELTVLIKDSKGAEVYKEVLRTNEMGSFAGSYEIDEEGALGDYTIYANIDENNSYSSGFTVEQYKKPEYKVTVITDKGQYYGKDNMHADIEAKYYFGSFVAEADVEYNIYKVRYYKPWWMFSEYAWWYQDYYENQDDNQRYSGAEFIYSGTGKLDKEGKLSIDYTINEEFKEDDNRYEGFYRPYFSQSDYKYIIQAKVVDKSRREISGTATAFVTRGGFSLSANSDKYLYKPDETVNMEVFAFDFSDKPVETDFEALIYKTTWERDSYKEKKDYVKTISGRTKKDGKGIVTFNIGGGDVEGSYNVEIKAKDERSNLITTNAYFYVSKGDRWWNYDQSGGIQIITDKDSYRQGEICRALIFVTNADVNALVTTNTDDILSFSLEKFTGTSKMIEIPITDKYISGFEININYVFSGVFYNSSKNVLVIPEEKFLTVIIEPSKLIYKPKEKGELKVKVIDNNGQPVRNAEVSIGVVDESIYSIKEDNTKDIRKFFYGQKAAGVSTSFNNNSVSNGQSRLMTIYERFNISSTSEIELATVRGRLLTKNNDPIPNAIIVIDKDYRASATDENGNFEFRLPAGNYTIGAYYDGITKNDLVDLKLTKAQTKTVTLYNDKELNLERGEINADQSGRITDQLSMSPTEVAKSNNEESGLRGLKEKKMDKDGETFVNADMRSDFRDAVLWSPYSTTDAQGYAVVSVEYPDNLTTWRITSRVITEDTKVGQMTSTVI